MIWHKTCPRCNGDLVLELDLHGDYISCVQCGGILSERQKLKLLNWTNSPSYYSRVLAASEGRKRTCKPARQARQVA